MQILITHFHKYRYVYWDTKVQARSRGLLARVQLQTKIVLVFERGLEARGYVPMPPRWSLRRIEGRNTVVWDLE